MVVGQEVCQMASLIPGGRWESPKTTITYFSPGAKTGATLCLPSNPVTLTTDTSASFTNLFLENKVPQKKKLVFCHPLSPLPIAAFPQQIRLFQLKVYLLFHFLSLLLMAGIKLQPQLHPRFFFQDFIQEFFCCEFMLFSAQCATNDTIVNAKTCARKRIIWVAHTLYNDQKFTLP